MWCIIGLFSDDVPVLCNEFHLRAK
jgi:hypothetical protein